MDYNKIRRKTKRIYVGGVAVGDDSPVSVQSMTNTDSTDADATLAQICALEKAGCDIVRMAIHSLQCVGTIYKLKEAGVKIPIVADIHFSHKLAIEAAEAGADKIRINPGNIGDADRVRAVADKCREKGIPIRIGVNSGSLDKKLLAKYGSPTAEALVQSALDNIALLEKCDFNDIIVAIKSSDVVKMIDAVGIVASKCDYPFHLGVTEAGSETLGTVKSAVGIGSLLTRGIGDTIRVSLTADPVLEVVKGRAILNSLGMDVTSKIELVSCPTCGRTRIDLIPLVHSFEARMGELTNTRRIKVAIMGCAVNGPGEARDADIGIAGGVGEVLLFRHGQTVCKLPEENAVDALIEEINKERDL